MEHIRQFDWCTSGNEPYFVTEHDLDNSVTEKLLRNAYCDPLLHLTNENVECNNKIDWDEVFKKKHNQEQVYRVFVPGMRAPPPYPKLSALTGKQHFQCLKVICYKNPHILPNEILYRPTKTDYKVFEDVKEIYENEQKEFIEWAKTLWTNSHCLRALRPKPIIENIYEGEFKMREQAMKTYPKNFSMAAQISLECNDGDFELVHKKDLVKINLSDLPEIDYPHVIEKKWTILQPCAVPEPCHKHPCRFILPNEKTVSVLPLCEIFSELAQFACEAGAEYIASESALKCLLETDREWILPLSVCQAIQPDGEKVNVNVFGSEFITSKEGAPTRTYRAYRHLVYNALVPPSEKLRIADARRISSETIKQTSNTQNSDELSSDDEDDRLLIDILDDIKGNNIFNNEEVTSIDTNKSDTDVNTSPANKRPRLSTHADQIGVYTCVCKDSLLEEPPPRSYDLWEVNDKKTNEKYSIVIHRSHKAKSKDGKEVILEPIPEYQVDVAGSAPSEPRARALALQRALRPQADTLHVRLVADCGEVVSVEPHAAPLAAALTCAAPPAAALHAALRHLRGLRTGQYILQHKANHGANMLVLRAGAASDEHAATLCLAGAAGGAAAGGAGAGAGGAVRDEALQVRAAPRLAPALLPAHKYRRILPCAFTPHENLVVKEPKKPVVKQKHPPQALKLEGEEGAAARGKWPKKKKQKRKRRH